jgi:tRNA C32,U32 (ribose-2'-O)-methylase TrmJ
MRTLRQIAYRAALRPDEVALLLAIARQILRTASR